MFLRPGETLPENGGWKTACATLRGTAHEASGLPCQDQVLALSRGGVTVVALADGAGSAALSHEGAALACRRAAQAVAERFDEVFRRNIPGPRFAAWLAGGLQWELSQLAATLVVPTVEDVAADTAGGESNRVDALQPPHTPTTTEDKSEEGESVGIESGVTLNARETDAPQAHASLRDLASTLLLAAADDERYLVLHLGDGCIGAQVTLPDGRRALRTLSAPQNGEFANETVFTTSPQAAGALRVLRGPLAAPGGTRIAGFVLMSDGPQASLFHKPTRTLAPGCAKFMRWTREFNEEKASGLLDAVLRDSLSRKTPDDLSLAVLAR